MTVVVVDRHRLFGEAKLRELQKAIMEVHFKSSGLRGDFIGDMDVY